MYNKFHLVGLILKHQLNKYLGMIMTVYKINGNSLLFLRIMKIILKRVFSFYSCNNHVICQNETGCNVK